MECTFCGCKPCECAVSKLTEIKESPTLSGATILFATSGSSGSHTNHFGNGSIDLDFHKPGQLPPWTHIGDIHFSSPTAEQLEDMQTSPMHSEGYKEYCSHKRRMSKKQAEFLRMKISNFIMDEFKGMFPSDDEIDDLMAEARMKK